VLFQLCSNSNTVCLTLTTNIYIADFTRSTRPLHDGLV